MFENLLEQLNYARMEVIISPRTPVKLPSFLGATIRGALGASLRMVSCGKHTKKCEKCAMAYHCAYYVLYERFDTSAGSLYQDRHKVPAPIIIEPPDSVPKVINPGDFLTFHIILLDDALKYYAHVLEAVTVMCEKGFGLDGTKFDFFDAQMVYGNICMVLRSNQVNRVLRPIVGAPLLSSLDLDLPKKEVFFDMLTPLRIISAGATEIPVTFKSIVHSLIHKLTSLTGVANTSVMRVGIKETLKLLDSVKVVDQCQHAVTIPKWENPHNRGHDLVGATGYIIWQGSMIQELWPLLKAGELLHAGKATTFGFGKYRIKSFKQRS